ncbi:succinate-acetate transporter [Bacteroidales bacterium]|nr:succinate-acetate transporter [Bacteroidales bacterium]
MCHLFWLFNEKTLFLQLKEQEFYFKTENKKKMEKRLANPAPLGLMGFAMTTILLNIHNMGFFPISVSIIAMGIFYGGLAQIIAGIMEFKKGNTFGTTAFLSFGLFWLSLVAIWIMPDMGYNLAGASDANTMGWYLFLWGVFAFFMWMGTWGGRKVSQFIFFTATALFFLLAIHNWTASNASLSNFFAVAAGCTGVICGSAAFYLAMAEVLHESRGKVILPY